MGPRLPGGVWVLLQVLDFLVDAYGWPPIVLRAAPVVLAMGFFVALVLAWYHGEQGRQRFSGPELLILAGILLLAGTALALVTRGSGDTGLAGEEGHAAASAEGPAARASIAVLPFVNMSGDAEQEYFSDGLTEELLNALAQVPGLQVAARTSSFAFKGQNLPVEEIARRLRVAHVLEGSVRRSGDRLRITAQLVDATNGYHLWSETYDREMAEVFAIQEEIAGAIVSALKLTLSAQERAALVQPGTNDLEAYNLYLQGRYHISRFTEDDLREAVELFRAAIQRDPGYADAYAGISDAWSWLADDWMPPREAFPRAEAAARKAIELDPDRATGHFQLAVVLWGLRVGLRRSGARVPARTRDQPERPGGIPDPALGYRAHG